MDQGFGRSRGCQTKRVGAKGFGIRGGTLATSGKQVARDSSFRPFPFELDRRKAMSQSNRSAQLEP